MSAPNPKAFPLADANLTNQVCLSLAWYDVVLMVWVADFGFGSAGWTV
jgi:hypothetical protein